MIILAFDTCLDKTYITLRNENENIKNKIIFSNDENYHSAYLISSIVSILKSAGLTPNNIDIIATDVGPGSFTGIRACTTVARVLSQQLDIKAVGVSSLEILSKILGGEDMVVLDARKNMGYVYDREIVGAIDLDKVDNLVAGRRVITDDNLYERINKSANNAISYQQAEYPLGEILAKIALTRKENDWKNLKPLYIQPPPVWH